MGAVCPAQITVYDTHDGRIDVQFVSTHVGHDFEEIHCHGYLKKYRTSYPSPPKRERRWRNPATGQLEDGNKNQSQEPENVRAIAAIHTDPKSDNGFSDEVDPNPTAVYQLVHDQMTNEPVYILQVNDAEADVTVAIDTSQQSPVRRSRRHQNTAVDAPVTRPATASIVMQCNMCPAVVQDLRAHYQNFHKISSSKIDLFLGIQ